MLEGLLAACSGGWNRIVFEFDALAIIDCLGSNDGVIDSDFRPQTQDIHSLVYDKHVIFHFLIRNGNRLLHRLAYTTLFSSVSEIWDFVLS
ncbi:hypothetical protein LguiA_002404 [Lonicera macranthoides]